jgi:thiosulfate/3-mercaptopyruvate sulfurtransferase
MKLRTLVDPTSLASLIDSGNVLVVDCRCDLADPARARHDYAQSHIPGALYADLNRDLSDLDKQGLGRHPLPEPAAFSAVLERWGWTAQTRVVAYDAANGALAAARLWWMLRLVGARDVAVLDGGFTAWLAAGLPLASAVADREPSSVHADFDPAQVVYTAELQSVRKNVLLLDARAAPRFRGQAETIDPVAGHIPGARNRPFSDNLLADGHFKPASQLRTEFEALLGARRSHEVVHMCGSGVTACHNLLAMEHAGLSGSRVYAPSWSGWIADRTRPVATGE